jgi:hypothetical protein
VSGRRSAGLGALAFPILAIAALSVADAQGGSFDSHAVARFTSDGHRNAILVSLALAAVGAAALAVVIAYLTDTYLAAGWHRRIVWSATVLAAGMFLTGWTVMLAPSYTVSLGGGPPIQPAVAYTLVEAGLGVFLLGGAAIGAGLIALAHGAVAMPTWMRAITGIAGILGLLSIAFDPFFAILAWSLATGIWLIASRIGAPVAAAAAEA